MDNKSVRLEVRVWYDEKTRHIKLAGKGLTASTVSNDPGSVRSIPTYTASYPRFSVMLASRPPLTRGSMSAKMTRERAKNLAPHGIAGTRIWLPAFSRTMALIMLRSDPTTSANATSAKRISVAGFQAFFDRRIQVANA